MHGNACPNACREIVSKHSLLAKITFSMTPLLILAVFAIVAPLTTTQLSIPRGELGLVYNNGRPCASVKIAAYVDLTCPYSKQAFPTLLRVADSFTDSQVQLRFYIFSLPYHRNSHLISKATRYLSGLPSNATGNATIFDWIQVVYQNIDYLTTTGTVNKTEVEVFSYLTTLAQRLFPVTPDQFKQGTYDSDIDVATRLEWKYGCTRGVHGTPSFSVNDVFVDVDSTYPASQWISLIKTLLPSGNQQRNGC
ncbi:unnamed protein product [Lymnaea stagnalis]|uniref:Thioredoxin-like fold domain-containing protein n=1 Tax=Lymnaea stagnalis TaxID=6523 RepID=A0AAV2HIV2_LYMST